MHIDFRVINCCSASDKLHNCNRVDWNKVITDYRRMAYPITASLVQSFFQIHNCEFCFYPRNQRFRFCCSLLTRFRRLYCSLQPPESSYRSITSQSDLNASEPSTAINLISRSPGWMPADSLTNSHPLYVSETTRR